MLWTVPESEDERTDYPVSPPPPWPAAVRATLWWHRSTPDAAQYGPTGAILPITLAMMVDYLDSPVGPYREVLASPVLRRGLIPAMAVPFIAVDSEPSVHGGREHWKLPKVLAKFDGDVLGDFSATGARWNVATSAAPKVRNCRSRVGLPSPSRSPVAPSNVPPPGCGGSSATRG